MSIYKSQFLKVVFAITCLAQVSQAGVQVLPYLRNNLYPGEMSDAGPGRSRKCGDNPRTLDIWACFGREVEVVTVAELINYQNQVKSLHAALEKTIHTSNTTTDQKLEKNQAELYDKVSSTYKDMMKDETFRKFVLSIVNEELDRRARDGGR